MDRQIAIDKWISYVSTSPYSDTLTYKLNSQVELSNTSSVELSRLWQKFADFLVKNLTDADGSFLEIEDVFSSPPEIIKGFLFDQTANNIKIAGPPVNIGERTLTTQQSFGKLRNSPEIDYLCPQFAALILPINNKLANNVGLSDKKEFRRWFKELQEEIQSVIEGAPIASMGEFEFEFEEHELPSELQDVVLWLTIEEELSKLVNPGCLKPSAATSSFLMAKQRYASGLYHGLDDEFDDQFIERFIKARDENARNDVVAYKIAIKLDFVMHKEITASQPTSFSDGYEDLFLSYPPDADLGGRACRLKLSECSHHDCNCAKEGVPEVVASARDLALSANAKIDDIVPLLPRHLRKYQKPSVEFIEKQRGAS